MNTINPNYNLIRYLKKCPVRILVIGTNCGIIPFHSHITKNFVRISLLHVLSALSITQLTRVAGGPDQTSSRQTVYTERAVT